MSLITRCPACGTMFKVVPDQLRISEGWVRCGHCSDVFDASAQLQQETAKAAVEEPPEAQAVVDIEPPSADFGSSVNTEIDEALPSQVPDSAQFDEAVQALREDPRDQPFVLRRLDPVDEPPEFALPVRPLAEPAAQAEPKPEPEPELHDLAFVRQAMAKAFWARPAVRIALLVSMIALGLLLALQVAVHDRDRLAAADSALRPLLARLCEPLNCTVEPYRHIDAIMIDGSAFSKLRGDAYRLSVTLKNQGPTEVAVPALELTLTDGQDQPIVRRVVTPSDLGSSATVIAAGAEWSGSAVLAVAANGAGARIAGYRLLAFYP